MYSCTGHWFSTVQKRWDNPYCEGEPKERINVGTCYGTPFALSGEEFECSGGKDKPRRW